MRLFNILVETADMTDTNPKKYIGPKVDLVTGKLLGSDDKPLAADGSNFDDETMHTQEELPDESKFLGLTTPDANSEEDKKKKKKKKKGSQDQKEGVINMDDFSFLLEDVIPQQQSKADMLRDLKVKLDELKANEVAATPVVKKSNPILSELYLYGGIHKQINEDEETPKTLSNSQQQELADVVRRHLTGQIVKAGGIRDDEHWGQMVGDSLERVHDMYRKQNKHDSADALATVISGDHKTLSPKIGRVLRLVYNGATKLGAKSQHKESSLIGGYLRQNGIHEIPGNADHNEYVSDLHGQLITHLHSKGMKIAQHPETGILYVGKKKENALADFTEPFLPPQDPKITPQKHTGTTQKDIGATYRADLRGGKGVAHHGSGQSTDFNVKQLVKAALDHQEKTLDNIHRELAEVKTESGRPAISEIAGGTTHGTHRNAIEQEDLGNGRVRVKVRIPHSKMNNSSMLARDTHNAMQEHFEINASVAHIPEIEPRGNRTREDIKQVNLENPLVKDKEGKLVPNLQVTGKTPAPTDVRPWIGSSVKVDKNGVTRTAPPWAVTMTAKDSARGISAPKGTFTLDHGHTLEYSAEMPASEVDSLFTDTGFLKASAVGKQGPLKFSGISAVRQKTKVRDDKAGNPRVQRNPGGLLPQNQSIRSTPGLTQERDPVNIMLSAGEKTRRSSLDRMGEYYPTSLREPTTVDDRHRASTQDMGTGAPEAKVNKQGWAVGKAPIPRDSEGKPLQKLRLVDSKKLELLRQLQAQQKSGKNK